MEETGERLDHFALSLACSDNACIVREHFLGDFHCLILSFGAHMCLSSAA